VCYDAPVTEAAADERPRRIATWIAAAVIAWTALRAAVTPLWDADVWWILRAGEIALSEWHVPRENRFSFIAPEQPWVMHEWLFGVVYAALHHTAGLAALALVRVVTVAVVAWAMLRRAGRDAHPVIALGCVAFALIVYGDRFESPRPVGVSYAFVLVVASLAFDTSPRPRHALALACTMLVWANSHGSFPLGLVTIALAALLSDARRVRLAALAVSLAATLANPYGLAMHGLVGRYVSASSRDATALVHARILEWHPLLRDPLRVASIPALCGAVVLCAVWLHALREPRWRPRALLGFGLLGLALLHNRHLQLAGLVGFALAAGPLDSLARRFLAGDSRALSTVRLPALALAVGLLAWVPVAVTRSAGDWIDASHDDEAFDALLARVPDGARVFVALPFTGYAIWRGYPRVRLFFDTRNDCHPYDALREGMDLNDGILVPETASATLARRRATHAIVSCRSRARRSFEGWTLVARRASLCLFEPMRARVGPP
jgi:hypothetical protein